MAMALNHHTIVIDNTNTRTWEYANYVWAAHLQGYEVTLVEFRVATVEMIKLCIRSNQHGVSPFVISNQVIEFEIADKKMFPEDLKVEVIQPSFRS